MAAFGVLEISRLRLLASLASALTCASACGAADSTPRAVQLADAGPLPPNDIGPTGQPRVTLRDGVLEGRWLVDGMRAFLGIPFAKPPVGDLRWSAPERVEPWTDVRDAGKLSARCPQPPSTDRLNVESEDCLYLNVWVPRATHKLPVMVWIHGGGNVNGSGTEWVYDGQYLATEGVVLVTINYRLGVFGFFAHESGGDSGAGTGNQGLWDQQRALEWVHDNIEKFGGDPENVTIFGESAGAADVCMHVASPKSRGLFQRAISQSGGCLSVRSLASARRSAARFATQLGCGDADPIACLREKSIVEVVDAAGSAGGFNLIADGAFMPEQPHVLFDRGDIARVPYMFGSTTDEGSYWTLDATGITNDEQYLDALRKRFSPPVEPIAALYPASKFADAKDPYQAAVMRAWGDSRLVCPTVDVARRVRALDQPVYMFNWDIPVDDVIGAAHASELVFVFGTNLYFTPETRVVSDKMRAYWTNFAKTGDPNDGDLLEWPRRPVDEDTRINFSLDVTIISSFRGEECDFWIDRSNAAMQ